MGDDIALPQDEVSLRDYAGILRRRKQLIVGFLVVGLVVAVVAILMTRPVYQTTVRILVEEKGLKVASFDANNPISDLFSPEAAHDVATQIQILESDALLADAYKQAGLPFTPGLPVQDSAQVAAREIDMTDVIGVDITSTSPANAERLGSTLPATYLRYAAGTRQEEVAKSLSFTRGRLEQENRNLAAAEQALADFKARSHVSNLEKQMEQHVVLASSLQTDLDKARADAQGARAQLDALLKARQALPPLLISPTTTTNPNIQQTKDRIATLRTQRASLLVYSKPVDAKVQDVDSQIAQLEQYLRRLPPTTTLVTRTPNPDIPTFDNKIREARAAVAEKTASLSQAQSSVAAAGTRDFSPLEMTQARLQRDVDAHSGMVQALQKANDDLSIRAQNLHTPVRVIEAAAPAVQVAPRPLLYVSVALLLSLLCGVATALVWEHLDDRIYSTTAACAALQAPALGYIPPISGAESGRIDGPSLRAGELESYRMLRSNVQFAIAGSSLRSILVTSTLPGEGKTMTASNLAAVMALDGRRVILVDADLRCPRVHERFGLEREPGLTEVLKGEKSLEEVIRPTDIGRLSVVSAGASVADPADMLNSSAMRHVHQALKDQADTIIFDGPPIPTAADAQMMAAEADGVLFVVQLNHATRAGAEYAGELMRHARANVIGLVLNKVDPRDAYGSYGYGAYGPYRASGAAVHVGEPAVRHAPIVVDAERIATRVLAHDPQSVHPDGDGHGALDPAEFSKADDAVFDLVNPVTGQKFRLHPGSHVIGRAGSDIVLRDQTVSRRHALLKVGEDAVTLTDLGSTNGTFVNESTLKPGTPTPIWPGCTLELGHVTLLLDAKEAGTTIRLQPQA